MRSLQPGKGLCPATLDAGLRPPAPRTVGVNFRCFSAAESVVVGYSIGGDSRALDTILCIPAWREGSSWAGCSVRRSAREPEPRCRYSLSAASYGPSSSSGTLSELSRIFLPFSFSIGTLQ